MDQEKEFEIFVNSRLRKVFGPMISFTQLLLLAGVDASQDPAL
jgi:hypothetical protein